MVLLFCLVAHDAGIEKVPPLYLNNTCSSVEIAVDHAQRFTAGRIIVFPGLFGHVFHILSHTVELCQQIHVFVAHFVHLLMGFHAAALGFVSFSLPISNAYLGSGNLRRQYLRFLEPRRELCFDFLLHFGHIQSVHAGEQIGNFLTIFFQFSGSLQHPCRNVLSTCFLGCSAAFQIGKLL